MGGYIGTLVYNVLFGGLIGVAGTIYGLVVRNFVMTNAGQFEQIESQHYAQSENNQEASPNDVARRILGTNPTNDDKWEAINALQSRFGMDTRVARDVVDFVMKNL